MDLVSRTHLVLDGSLSDAAAAFWAAALGGSWRAAGPGVELGRVSQVPAGAGVASAPARGGAGTHALDASLVPVDGDAYVHRSGRGRVAPALTLEVDDVEAAVERVVALGGTGDGVLRSPGQLSFALVPAREYRRAPAAGWPDGTTSRLVQLCLDCPPEQARAEAEFWHGLTGWAWRDCDGPEFVCHLVPSVGSLQLLVQRRASALPREVTVHLDLGASDREAEATRLTALGATRVAAGDGWIVLADPDGRRFCATGQPPEAP